MNKLFLNTRAQDRANIYWLKARGAQDAVLSSVTQKIVQYKHCHYSGSDWTDVGFILKSS